MDDEVYISGEPDVVVEVGAALPSPEVMAYEQAALLVDVALQRGEQGPEGPAGARGERGAEGPQGRDGRDGVNGRDGRDGLNGVNGTNGSDGPIGPIGPYGPAGPKGDTGAVGPQGQTGASGVGAVYEQQFITAATTWSVTHNFNRPAVDVTLYTMDGELIDAQINRVDNNSFTVTFAVPVSGRVVVRP